MAKVVLMEQTNLWERRDGFQCAMQDRRPCQECGHTDWRDRHALKTPLFTLVSPTSTSSLTVSSCKLFGVW